MKESALRRDPARNGGASTANVPVQTTRVAILSPAYQVVATALLRDVLRTQRALPDIRRRRVRPP